MEQVLLFIEKYYIYFTIITVILLLSLLGNVVERNLSKDITIKGSKKLQKINDNNTDENIIQEENVQGNYSDLST